MGLTQKTGFGRRLLGKLGLVLFGVLFGCLLAEIALRVSGYSYPEFYQPDESRGYALRPNMEGWYRKEGAAYIKINSDGLRDQEHAKSKPADTLRIAVIGDSYPEALPVALEDAFWSVMGARLGQCGALNGSKIEVINFGVSGYGTAQEVLTLREQVWAYSPDVVMLAVTTNNDISDNLRQLKRTDQVPYFVFHDGQLVLDDSFKSTNTFRWRQSLLSRTGRWIRDHSRVVQAAIQGHHGFKVWLAARQSRKDDGAKPSPAAGVEGNEGNAALAPEDVGVDNLIYREPSDEVWNEAWDITEKLIVQMNREVRSRGAQFVVVTLSNGIQVYPDQQARAQFLERVGAKDLFYPDNRIKAIAEREHISVITLGPELQTYADQNKVFLHGFDKNVGNGHWNQLGHRVAGEAIASHLCNSLMK